MKWQRQPSSLGSSAELSVYYSWIDSVVVLLKREKSRGLKTSFITRLKWTKRMRESLIHPNKYNRNKF